MGFIVYKLETYLFLGLYLYDGNYDDLEHLFASDLLPTFPQHHTGETDHFQTSMYEILACFLGFDIEAFCFESY